MLASQQQSMHHGVTLFLQIEDILVKVDSSMEQIRSPAVVLALLALTAPQASTKSLANSCSRPMAAKSQSPQRRFQ